MSQFCPLCGKNKSEDALFCADCTKKMRAEYEVDVPDTKDSTLKNTFPEEKGDGANKARNEVEHQQKVSSVKKKKKKRIWIPVLLFVLMALLTGGFFFYNETVRKNNLDRGAWDAAVKANSVEGYLDYIKAHPDGAHFEEAQDGLRRLKEDEAAEWERMRTSENTSELRDFLERRPSSPYVPLVKERLDSLLWVGSLQMNTPESYAAYIRLSEEGDVGGDYIAAAKKRYDLLSLTHSGDSATLDSIRLTIDGFFASLSSLNHDGLMGHLAPTVYRFFNFGAATSERIVGELLVKGAQTEGSSLKFIPDLASVQYEMSSRNHYKVNVPLQKSYRKDGATEDVFGYIAHIELDTLFRIVSIFETKPYPEAP